MKQTTDSLRLEHTDLCPDCISREDVDLLGRTRKGRWAGVRYCAGCDGSTRVASAKEPPAPPEQNDPWIDLWDELEDEILLGGEF